MSDASAVWPQYLLPKRALTVLAGRLGGARAGSVTTAVIRRFVARYGVDMSEAANPDIGAYASFNEFFTRALKPGARPLAQADLVCPVDGAISQLGAIDGERILQAKGHDYTVAALVGGDRALAAHFQSGATSPRCTSARATTTASTCPAPGGCCA
jgi:phosphatidylserine decarboxylase